MRRVPELLEVALAEVGLRHLVILSDDPTTVAVDSLPGIGVLTTMVGGKVEHCADTTLC